MSIHLFVYLFIYLFRLTLRHRSRSRDLVEDKKILRAVGLLYISYYIP